VIPEALEYHRNRPVPLRFSVLAGEVIHQLRSILDRIVWQFSDRRYWEFNGKWIEFPILEFSVSEYSALRGGDFQGMGSFDPMEVGRRKNESSRPPFIVSMSPPGYPSAWLRPRVPASVSPGKFIVAPPSAAVPNSPPFRPNEIGSDV
jgi:hypothetical protein